MITLALLEEEEEGEELEEIELFPQEEGVGTEDGGEEDGPGPP